MNLAGISFKRLSSDHSFKAFDCTNVDLNDFLFSASKDHQEKLIAVTYLLENESHTVAFFSLLNDKITIEQVESKSRWRRKIRDMMPQGKRYNSYPAMKLGRLGVNSDNQKQGIGKSIIDYLKIWFIDKNKTGCRFITVDALKKSIPFYQRNGFEFLTEIDKNEDSRLMYFDLTLLTTKEDQALTN